MCSCCFGTRDMCCFGTRDMCCYETRNMWCVETRDMCCVETRDMGVVERPETLYSWTSQLVCLTLQICVFPIGFVGWTIKYVVWTPKYIVSGHRNSLSRCHDWCLTQHLWILVKGAMAPKQASAQVVAPAAGEPPVGKDKEARDMKRPM